MTEFTTPESEPLLFSSDLIEGLDGGDAVALQPETATYWSLSRTPLASLVFTLPMVLA